MEAAASHAKQGLTPSSDSHEGIESPPQSLTYARAACTECARRKQRCNREWPCNHCKKRKVGNQCRYSHDSPVPGAKPATPQDTKRKRDRSEDHEEAVIDTAADAVDYGGEGFEALGYSTAHLFASLSNRDEATPRKPASKECFKDAASCPPLARALTALPPRPHTDSLVQNFLNNVNYHYYTIYAPNFLEEYQAWWKDRVAQKPLSIQWTCLLIMICACSCQYTDAELQRRLEEELAEPLQILTERYHNTARELYSIISVGHNHLLNVQMLLHSCYWYKGEVQFVECWHVLASAIREAEELGIHQESRAGPIPEFEREMRRRIWCILNTWDWQVSNVLGRPMIIDRSDCDIGLPSLSLEDFDPSPLLHMKLQSQLIDQLARTFGSAKHVVAPEDVKRYLGIVEAWMDSFPKWYEFENPDRSKDEKQPWMKLHRHFLHISSNSMILDPVRAYLARDMSRQSSPDELDIRRVGIEYSLRLVKALRGFFEHVYPQGSRFQFVIFFVFHTASLLCSAIIHDQDGSMPGKNEMLEAVEGALDILKQLTEVTSTAKISHQVLGRIATRAKMAAGQFASSEPQRTNFAAIHDGCLRTPNTPAIDHSTATMLSIPQGANSFSYAGTSSMAYTPLPATVGPQHNDYHHNDFRMSSGPQHSDYSIPMQYPMQAFVPQATFTPHAPAAYAMDSMMQQEPIMNSHTMPSNTSENGIINGVRLSEPAQVPTLDLSAITEEELGQLTALWQYRSLNLDFINPQP